MGVALHTCVPAATAPLAFTFTWEDPRRKLAHSRTRERTTRR
jgi:hypothetical protein